MAASQTIKAQDHGTTIEAVKYDGGKMAAHGFFYRVIAEPSAESPADRRHARRHRLRFRGGKLIDTAGRFLSECSIGERGGTGCGVALRSSLPLPRRVRLYDDHSGTIDEAVVVWHSGQAVGLALLGPATVSRQIRATLGASLYALTN